MSSTRSPFSKLEVFDAAASLPGAKLSFGESAADAHLGPQPNLWLRCLHHLQGFLPEKQIRNWLHPLQVDIAEDESSIKIYVASRYKLDYIRSQYSAIIQKSLQQIANGNTAIFFALDANKKPSNLSNTSLSLSSAPIAAPKKVPQPEMVPATENTNSALLPQERTRLNPQLNFENLVEGSANRMARTAGLHIATQSGNNYNPMFIYGASGLGKTHLLHAIGNMFLAQKPQARVLYVHADQFVSDVVKACRYNSFEQFKSYYHALDLLLLDDVQELGDKGKTLEEFFNTFNALLSKHSHIIMTSDTYPKELVKIPDRLVSRFVSGLTVGLEPPDLEMRVAILLRKAAQEAIELPEDVAFFIAKNVPSNVRELEGALRNVLAYARFKSQAITITSTREALRDLLSVHNRQITVENIQKTVADFYRIKVADMYSKRRPANIAKPRQIAMYLAKEMTQKSLPEIGNQFGGRDHTTVLHAVKKIAKDRQLDTELNQHIHILEQSLKT